MSLILKNITINTNNLTHMCEFYKTLGLDLKRKSVTLGSQIFEASLDGGAIFSIFGDARSQKNEIPSLQLYFAVPKLSALVQRLEKVPGAIVMMSPTEMPDGTKAIVLDPDGHSVEFVEIK